MKRETEMFLYMEKLHCFCVLDLEKEYVKTRRNRVKDIKGVFVKEKGLGIRIAWISAVGPAAVAGSR